MVLDLTVAAGTVNGLIFYANIIQAQHYTFFTQNTSHFLRMFISWINTTAGFERCFFFNLDQYTATWLEVPVPLFFWSLAGAVIVLSHYSPRFSQLIGKNSVQVLATLFLISYARLLRLIIDVFAPAWLYYPDGNKKQVWHLDGNVEYFEIKRVPLLIVTTFLVALTLPYTIVLLTIQLLYKVSHYRAMCWVQRLKPFSDAYTAPYKANHRYWTGLLLLVRIILMLTFTVNSNNNSSVNLTVIVIATFVLIAWFALAGGVYEAPLNNFLETLFLCNLGITSVVVLLDEHKKAAVSISISISFATFVCIILCHATKRLVRTKLGSKLKQKLSSHLPSIKERVDVSINREFSMTSSAQLSTSVTSTTVELKELLLEDDF